MRREHAALVGVASLLALATGTIALAQTRPGHVGHAPAPQDGGAPPADAAIAAPLDGGVPAPDAGPAVPAPDAATTGDDDDRDDWRVAPDLVDPFPELHGTRPGAPPETDDDDEAHLRPLRPRSWYLIEEDLVDPWDPGERRAYHVASCGDVPCGPLVESASRLAPPHDTLTRRAAADATVRLRRTQGVDVALLAGASSLANGDARARLEAAITLRQGTFLVGLGLTISGGTVSGVAEADDGHLYVRRTGYGRHGAVLVLGHRMTDGVLKLDLTLELGALLSVMQSTDVLPLVRLAATGALSVARGVALLARLDVGTTFLAPAGFVDGPTALDVGIFLGVRLGSD